MAPVHKTSEDAIDKPDRRRRAPPHIILHTLPAFSFSTPTHSIRIQFAYQTPPARANPARTKMTTAVAGNGAYPRLSLRPRVPTSLPSLLCLCVFPAHAYS
ncbi:hypothetical protein C2E23DRAFT_815681 [Lenzites betulinus]|nr:hypothetical protein C2E23DRAFT_815681 [Lenzites betulinus]